LRGRPRPARGAVPSRQERVDRRRQDEASDPLQEAFVRADERALLELGEGDVLGPVGFLDLLSCVPALRIFRLFRIVRAVRIVRRLGGPRVLREMRQELASGALYFIIFVGITVLEVVGLLELRFEEDVPGANITTAGDALWWGYVTATTVGYGDYYPVTIGGRISGVIMLTVGVGLFATFSGFLANAFLSPRKRKPAETPPDIAEIHALLDQQEATAAQLRAKLEQLQAAR